MKKIISMLIFIICCLICCSCTDKKHFNHNNGFIIIDETCNYNEKYYGVYDEEVLTYSIYLTKSKELIESIKLYSWNHSICIYDDYIYMYYIENNAYHVTFKKINDACDIYENTKKLDENFMEGFLTINNQLFLINGNDKIVKVGYNLNQGDITGFYNYNLYTLGKQNDMFLLNISNEDKKLELKSYYDNNTYTYMFSKEVINAQYNYKTNYAYWNWPSWNEETNEFYPGSYSVFLNDECLYFSYSKYLGEFTNGIHDCSMPTYCFFSNCKTEVLRFNTDNKKIESVAILPDGYRVLKIYKDYALIMKNNLIAKYDFVEKKLEVIQEVNWDNYYQLQDSFDILKVYLKDDEIYNIDTHYNKNGIGVNFDSFNKKDCN